MLTGSAFNAKNGNHVDFFYKITCLIYFANFSKKSQKSNAGLLLQSPLQLALRWMHPPKSTAR